MNNKRLQKWQTRLLNEKKEPSKEKSFVKLQQEWYNKLKDQGFRDIEYTCPKTGREEVGFFRDSDAAKESLRRHGHVTIEDRLWYWRAMSNYLQHNPEWYNALGVYSDELKEKYQFIIERYIEGIPYRDIADEWKRLNPDKASFSYFVVYKIAKKYKKMALKWNREHEEGLRYDEDMDTEGGEA